ncbi:MAG: hypothetical protein EOO26_02845 [Comamonadaceae bacterium]|nr:MAG: hypothetical protein EOO26_02845 [Comamonadaceae bacterium]
MRLNLVVDGRSWAGLFLVEFLLLAVFLVGFLERRPLPLSAMETSTILIGSHAEHGEIELGTARDRARTRRFWPSGIWLRPRTGDTMFDVQGPVAEGFRPWLDTREPVRVLFRPGTCRPPSGKTSGGDNRFVRVCVVAEAQVGNQTIGRYPPKWTFNWLSFFALCLWTAVIVYFFRRQGRIKE